MATSEQLSLSCLFPPIDAAVVLGLNESRLPQDYPTIAAHFVKVFCEGCFLLRRCAFRFRRSLWIQRAGLRLAGTSRASS